MSEYIVVTESGSDITCDCAAREGIVVVPMHVTFGDESRDDDGSFDPEVIYDHYRTTGELPHTSGCSPHDFELAFDRIHTEHPSAQIIYLAYSAITTVSHASALVAAEGRGYVHAYDTKSVSSGLHMVVTNVARWLRANPDVTIGEVDAFVADQVDRIRMAFIPGDLDYLRAGGRLSNAAFLGAMLLRIKPTVEIVDGQLVATEKRRGSMYKCSIDLTDHFLDHEPLDTGRVTFIYSVGDKPDHHIRAVVEGMVGRRGFDEVEWVKTGAIISSHCGPGAFGIVGLTAKA
ncbi:MAG: DegV family EDD domain-containing protein [Atopobiaceae bacterium]|jgi:DegV family protein with EDD domain|nr:DegV family EDD domain-containing protein [Atopobiaceae bacterium]MCH4179872.1 DegV family EDD domain-containing protein [Atopobiaceae bacterium]MCH4213623.1 DegV family EDD domain-containing protein [Atopobiaceae bacterium]MCH4229628.1 DegV family EDD domain-containing protein [Atopobiaceae bacterium]MCH4276020.1 DegV family EDD domain-containing protein [Atopobiaceae bacterium]